MKSILVSFLALVTFAAYAEPGHEHLSFANGAIHAHATWTQGPQSPAESVLRLEWKNGADHSPVEPGRFRVSLWMPDMGHGSAPTQIQRVLDERGEPILGSYDVRNVYFTMGGKWDVRVSLKLANGTEETKAFSVMLDGGGHGHH